MKKNIVIGFLILICILSITYGYYQKNRADKIEAVLSKEKLMEDEFRKSTEDMVKKIKNMKNDSSFSLKEAEKKSKK